LVVHVLEPERLNVDAEGEPAVRGFIHRASSPGRDGLILTHGAGGNCESPLLADLAASFAESGVTVLRCDLPFRQIRPHGPPTRGSAERDQEGLRRAVTVLRRLFPGKILLGGHSYGGRQATMLAAADQTVCDGLLLLSYPLHPPGKASQPRTSHFPLLAVQALFVQGDRDPFATHAEMKAAIALIPAVTRLFGVEGEAHSLWSKRSRATLPAAVVQEALGFFGL
jgi:predicted alpha/beta-hydrolase family hydrolase